MSVEQQQLIHRDIVARHEELMREYGLGVMNQCMALWSIRAEETYRALGIDSWTKFLERLGLSIERGRLLANAGPVLRELAKTGHAEMISHVDMLAPIYNMLVTDGPRAQDEEKQQWVIRRQATIVRIAASVAKKRMVPLTREVIKDVAEKNFGWLPPSKRKRRGETIEDERDTRGEDFERAVRVLAELRLNAFEVMSLLNLKSARTELYGFRAALQLLKDVDDAEGG